MNIADLILALQNGQNPNAAISASMQAPDGGFPAVQPPGGDAAPVSAPPASAVPSVPIPQPRPPGAPPAPPAPTPTPTGVATPITNPMPSEGAPRIMQSPPDLSNMYLKLIEKSQNAAALDSGASLIAAGFSKYPEIRTGLISGAMNKSGQQHLTSEDIVRLQTLQVKNQQLGIRQAAKASLMKQYNLSRDAVDYLDASDKLDEVIKHRETGSLQVVTDASGQVSLYDNATHKKIADVGGPKARETEIKQAADGTFVTIYKDTGELVKPEGVGPKKERETESKTLADGTVITVYKDTGEPVTGKTLGPKKVSESFITDKGITLQPPTTGHEYKRNAEGKIITDDNNVPTSFPVVGTEEATKAAKIEEAKFAKTMGTQAASTAVRDAARSAIKVIDEAPTLLPAAGFAGSLGLKAGSTPSVNLRAQLDTIKANVGFEQLQQMRSSSPTGAALGPVSDFENRLLSSTIASLDQGQDAATLKQALKRVVAATNVIANNKFEGDAKVEQGRFNKLLDAELLKVEKEFGPTEVKGTSVKRIK